MRRGLSAAVPPSPPRAISYPARSPARPGVCPRRAMQHRPRFVMEVKMPPELLKIFAW